MKITREVRDFAAQRGLTETDAQTLGLELKAAEFQRHGGRLYVPVTPVG